MFVMMSPGCRCRCLGSTQYLVQCNCCRYALRFMTLLKHPSQEHSIYGGSLLVGDVGVVGGGGGGG